ncbi:MAG: hypothetical protein R2912_00755 [Eubacteriales bacterium]
MTTAFVIIKSVGAFSYRNPQIALLIALGLGWFLVQKRDQVRIIEKINVVLMAGLLACAIYIGGQGYRYYGLVLTPFMALGMVPIVRLWSAGNISLRTNPGLSARCSSAFRS